MKTKKPMHCLRRQVTKNSPKSQKTNPAQRDQGQQRRNGVLGKYVLSVAKLNASEKRVWHESNQFRERGTPGIVEVGPKHERQVARKGGDNREPETMKVARAPRDNNARSHPVKIPDTSHLQTGMHRLPAPDTGPMELEARLLALVEWDVPPEWQLDEAPTVKVSIRLFEASDGQAVYCCIHLDPSGHVKKYDVVIRPSLREFFAKRDHRPFASHKELLLAAMVQQAANEQ